MTCYTLKDPTPPSSPCPTWNIQLDPPIVWQANSHVRHGNQHPSAPAPNVPCRTWEPRVRGKDSRRRVPHVQHGNPRAAFPKCLVSTFPWEFKPYSPGAKCPMSDTGIQCPQKSIQRAIPMLDMGNQVKPRKNCHVGHGASICPVPIISGRNPMSN